MSDHFIELKNGKIEQIFSKEEAKISDNEKFLLTFRREVDLLKDYLCTNQVDDNYTYTIKKKNKEENDFEELFKLISKRIRSISSLLNEIFQTKKRSLFNESLLATI